MVGAMADNHEIGKTGTREWSDVSVNISRGCSHRCTYCYARANALRFKRIASPEEWEKEIISRKLPIERRKHDGVVMFPTTHDITQNILPDAVDALRNLLSAGNRVLIVSKPHFDVIDHLCDVLSPWRSQVLFRFSIGTLDDGLAAIWEPGAPPPGERLLALCMASGTQWQTSVSMEPALHTATTFSDIHQMLMFVTDTIWVGKMNHVRARVIGVQEDHIRALEKGQTDDRIIELYQSLKHLEKVRWKDSIKAVLKRHGIETTVA
jgi:DNA repair photolyase